MPDPTPEHLASLARVLDPANIKSRGYLAITPHEAAKALYAAVRTDPEVQDAMLAALAEGGRLVEEEGLWPCPSRHYDRDHNGEWCDEACRSYEGHAGDHECVSGRHWPRTADDLPRKVHWIEPEWREVPQ
ncbi:MAG: hypothetical protein IPN98_08375 [Propionivibrio sp.]|jgi:hypothetical protein|nr:hypothetical protein [Propionivibrio sp.]